jgi:hypothetical protein
MGGRREEGGMSLLRAPSTRDRSETLQWRQPLSGLGSGGQVLAEPAARLQPPFGTSYAAVPDLGAPAADAQFAGERYIAHDATDNGGP